MYIDLLGPESYLQYNIKLAKYLGLHTAIYISAILRVKNKAILDKTLVNNTFNIDKNYIKDITLLDFDEQSLIEKNLQQIKLITNPTYISDDLINIKFHEDILINIITDVDVKTLTSIKNSLKVKVDANPVKLTQRDKKFLDLKNSINCLNPELDAAYKNWVDGVAANPKGFLSLRAINIFQKTVDDFAQGDLDLALLIIDIATINGYRDATWAINVFNKDYAAKWRKSHPDSVVNKPKDKETVLVSEEIF